MQPAHWHRLLLWHFGDGCTTGGKCITRLVYNAVPFRGPQLPRYNEARLYNTKWKNMQKKFSSQLNIYSQIIYSRASL